MSEAVDHLAVSRYIAEIDAFAESRGVHLEVRTDFEELWDLCTHLPGKPQPGVLFNAHVSDVGPHNAFWIEGSNDQNEVVHVQAVRCDDLSGTSLAQQIDSLAEYVAEPGTLPTDEEGPFCQAPTARKMTGKICYHGEIWLRGGQNGLRGKGLSTVLPRIILGLATAKWAPDYIWGLGQQWLVDKGLPQKYGYIHLEPRGTYLKHSKFKRPIDSWIMWLTQSELIDLTHADTRFDSNVGMEYLRSALPQTDKPRPAYRRRAS